MCRGKQRCTELSDPLRWDPHAPLPPGPEVPAHVLALGRAIRATAQGEDEQAAVLLSQLPGDGKYRDWYVEHAQLAWKTRAPAFARPSDHVSTSTRRMPTAPIAYDVWERDHYQCRYCGLPVIPRAVLAAFSAIVGPERFPFGRANAAKHEIGLLAWAQLDHVVPFSVGGRNDVDNIVTACAACNYGKDRFTVEELQVANPFSRPPSTTDWDGCWPILTALRRLSSTKAYSLSRVP